MDGKPRVRQHDRRFRDKKSLAEQIEIQHRARRERMACAKGANFFFERRAFPQPTGGAFAQSRNQSLQQRLLATQYLLNYGRLLLSSSVA